MHQGPVRSTIEMPLKSVNVPVPSPRGIPNKADWVSRDFLSEIMQKKSLEDIRNIGGLEGLAKAIKTNLETGLDAVEEESNFAERSIQYGCNVYPDPPHKSIVAYFWDACKDTTIIILFSAAVVSLACGIVEDLKITQDLTNSCDLESSDFYYPSYTTIPGWLEGFSILIAVLIVALVSAVNNWSKEKQFQSLNNVKNDRRVKVIRGGQKKIISIYQVQVGDVVSLDTGDQVPADGIFISGHNVEIDESAITGESEAVCKDISRPFLFSGCQVTCGVGSMLVTSVGEYSEWGLTLAKLAETETDETPLQKKLGTVAQFIGHVGVAAAVLTFGALVIQWAIGLASCSRDWHWNQLITLLDYFILSVTIVVVAVPEGLPLAVTISLAYSMRKMLADKNLVRVLEACETMGGATNICSDKTGTLTENRMTAVEAHLNGMYYTLIPPKSEFMPSYLDLVAEAISVNSLAYLTSKPDGEVEFVGNRTECALLVMLMQWDRDYDTFRQQSTVVKLYPFSSARKKMGTMICRATLAGPRYYVKGAPELLIPSCTRSLNRSCMVEGMSERFRKEITAAVDCMTAAGLRTLAFAYKDMQEFDSISKEPPEEDLIFLGLVGIKDPLRKEVPQAVKDCHRAGIFVRMVTGDNLRTAKFIAAECGILTVDGIAMEGPEFRKLSEDQVDSILPKLQVLARASPTDKYNLVHRLRMNGEVVAVTGDGTNDAPALKEADVGLSMGISGTEVAKEASDIVIMDDNFSSIVKAVLWGRSVYDNIRKFLQFQLTVNVVALVIAFIAAVTGMGRPLKPIQLLWVNMIMDSLGALSLATEPPSSALLHRMPYSRTESLISPIMARNILGQAVYQLSAVFILLYAGEFIFQDIIDSYYVPTFGPTYGETAIPSLVVNTMVFNAFVFCQIANTFNCRKLGNEINIFEGIMRNWMFWAIVVAEIVGQIIIVEVAGTYFDCISLNFVDWCLSFAIGCGALPWGFLIRLIRLPADGLQWKPGAPKPVEMRRQMRKSLDMAKAREEIRLKSPPGSSPKSKPKKGDAAKPETSNGSHATPLLEHDSLKSEIKTTLTVPAIEGQHVRMSPLRL